MSVLHQSILNVLRQAAEEGATEGEIAQAGGLWWRKRLVELGRKGFVISEDRGRFYLEHEPRGNPAPSTAGEPGSDPAVEAELTLFPTRGRSPYDLGEAA